MLKASKSALTRPTLASASASLIADTTRGIGSVIVSVVVARSTLPFLHVNTSPIQTTSFPEHVKLWTKQCNLAHSHLRNHEILCHSWTGNTLIPSVLVVVAKSSVRSTTSPRRRRETTLLYCGRTTSYEVTCSIALDVQSVLTLKSRKMIPVSSKR